MISKFKPYHEAKGVCVSYNETVERTVRHDYQKANIVRWNNPLSVQLLLKCSIFICKIYLSFFISKRSSLLTARCIIYFRYKSICQLMGKVHEEVTRKEVILGISSLFRLSSWSKRNKVGERAKITHDIFLNKPLTALHRKAKKKITKCTMPSSRKRHWA